MTGLNEAYPEEGGQRQRNSAAVFDSVMQLRDMEAYMEAFVTIRHRSLVPDFL